MVEDLTQADAQVVKLLDNFDAEYTFVDNDGPVFWIQTDLDAPRGKLIAIDTGHPEKSILIYRLESTAPKVSMPALGRDDVPRVPGGREPRRVDGPALAGRPGH